ncbi:MAG: arginine--tRNA ligase [Candidatus Aenigmarchaeota archaeon]|nr:arginine--tRNA ligase [Candidatus Aenigmarchaeota archaeon]
MHPFQQFRRECEELLGENARFLEAPKEHADLALPCFRLGKNPVEIAKKLEPELRSKVKKGSLIAGIEASGPYVNFFINNKKFSLLLVEQVLKEGKKYGAQQPKKERIMVEYAHPNTHKAFHVGHVRNICIGEALCRLLEKSGYKVIRANYQGDIGPHVAKCLWGLQNLGMPQEKNKGVFLGDIYATANAKIEGNPQLESEVQKISSALYRKSDKKLLQLWKKTRKWSLDYFDSIYKDFGVRFDRLYFESEVFEEGIRMARELLEKGVAEMSEGAIIVDLKKQDLGVCVILKSDEDPLYSTKDIGLVKKQFSEYEPDRIIHVVGSEQRLYFQQMLKIFGFINPDWERKSYHLSYELVMLQTGKISSRAGNVVTYEHLLEEGAENAAEEIKERGVSEEKAAKDIALAAVKYAILKKDTDRTITFDWSEVLNFEGDTGPYLQYTYARAQSILRRSKKKPRPAPLFTELEFDLAKKLAAFPETIDKAAKDLKPNYVANYLYELATLFNKYYHETRVVGNKEEEARLALVAAVARILKNGLELLGIKALEKM